MRKYSFFALLLFIYLFANSSQVGWVFLLTAFLTALYIYSYIYANKMLRDLNVKQWFEQFEVHREEEALFLIEIHNKGKTKHLLHCREKIFNEEIELTFLTIPADKKLMQKKIFIAKKRGIFSFSQIQISCSYPLGLYEAYTENSCNNMLIVFPKVSPSAINKSFLNFLIKEKEQEKKGQEAVFYGLRPYNYVDERKKIYWKKSLQQKGWVVKDGITKESQIISFCLPLQKKFWTEESFERAVEVIASFAIFALNEGKQVKINNKKFINNKEILYYLASINLNDDEIDIDEDSYIFFHYLQENFNYKNIFYVGDNPSNNNVYWIKTNISLEQAIQEINI